MILTSCIDFDGTDGTQIVRLPACSAEGSIFADVPFDQWSRVYHEYTSRAIDAHMNSKDDVSEQKMLCTAEDYEQLMVPSNALVAVAGLLPAWDDEEMLRELSEADMATVLLEFLRVYECSLNERKVSLGNKIQLEQTDEVWNVGTIGTAEEDQKKIIDREIKIARPTLERTLEVIGGYDRFRPLAADVKCIKRASLDLRNVLGLTAEASACLPRAAGAKGSLYDPPTQ